MSTKKYLPVPALCAGTVHALPESPARVDIALELGNIIATIPVGLDGVETMPL